MSWIALRRERASETSQVCGWPMSERSERSKPEGNARGGDWYLASHGRLFSDEEWDVSVGERRSIEKPEEFP